MIAAKLQPGMLILAIAGLCIRKYSKVSKVIRFGSQHKRHDVDRCNVKEPAGPSCEPDRKMLTKERKNKTSAKQRASAPPSGRFAAAQAREVDGQYGEHFDRVTLTISGKDYTVPGDAQCEIFEVAVA